MKIIKLTTIIGIGTTLVMFASQGYANVLFAFNEVGGTVTMTSSGSLDTTKLVPSTLPDGFNGTGFQDAGKNIDIIGGTSFGSIDTLFGFNTGTDISAITNPGGPLLATDTSTAVPSGSKSFATYSGTTDNWVTLEAGIGVEGSDIIGGIWTPDQNWVWGPGASFASLGLNVGTYTVSDALTNESITLQVIPEPATLALVGIFGGGLLLVRRYASTF